VDRPGSAAAKHRIGAGDELGQFIGIADHRAECGEPRSHRRLIVELVDRSPSFSLSGRRDGPGEHEHRLRIAIGLRDTRRGIGDSGTGDDRAHAWLAGGACVAVGHQARALLVSALDVPYPGSPDAPIELDRHRPGHAEDRVHLIGRQQLHDRLTTGHAFHVNPLKVAPPGTSERPSRLPAECPRLQSGVDGNHRQGIQR